MKKLLRIIASLMLVMICAVAIPERNAFFGGAGSITAEASSATSVKALSVGKSYTLKGYAKVKTSKKSVAAVSKKSSSKYTVKAKKKGTATIKCYDISGKLVKTIYLIATNASSFSYDTDSIYMSVGKSKTVTATVQKGCSVRYASSKTSVARVSTSGKITAVKAGSATISAKIYYKGKKIKTLKKKVYVKTAADDKYPGYDYDIYLVGAKEFYEDVEAYCIYIKTDNPDPSSFLLYETSLQEKRSIRLA